MLDMPGYRVIGTLRATSSNVLFRAVREADGVPLILKTPLAPAPGTLEKERYRREFTILHRLRNVRGVTHAYSCEWIHGRPVLLLEQVSGAPLAESRSQPMEFSRFLPLAISLVSILGEVHRHHVIHKDIKPSNILLEPSGEVRLVDFGVASLQQVEHPDGTPALQIEGTLAYMSPEQTGRMNRPVDHRTDFYSLGVTFYELLTGRRPFQAKDALEWFHAHMAHQPRPPHELNPQVPLALSALVMKLLAKVAEERYQSAEGLKVDLERCRDALGQSTPELFPLGTRDMPHGFQPPRRLYGRDAQVNALLEGLERVASSGRPELLVIRGYSGIGKSAVVQELYKPMVRRRGFFLSGKFDQFRRELPYSALVQTIQELVQQLLAGSDEELAGWRERMNRAWEGDGQLLVDLVPRLEVVVGRQPPLQELPSSEAQRRFFRVVRQFTSAFSTREKPAAVFLDDMQWAGASSLRMLEYLLSGPESPPVLWLAAYRDNEVGPSHALRSTLQSLREAGVRVTDIQLEPLGLAQVEQLVGDALPGAHADVVAPLATLLHEKTGGNPFFLLRLLVTLHHDGLLVRQPGGGWRWDDEGVRARDYSENIVDFMVDKLRQLPPDTQHLLRLAACAGNVFSPRVLGMLLGLPDALQVEQGLEPALQEGMLGRVGPEKYRFLHDRIQQAAHALSAEAERQRVHLRIGRWLLETLSPEELPGSLFDVVYQLNAAAALIGEPAERHRLARLNVEAGVKAQIALALNPARAYFTTAFSLIPGDPWETDPELAFKARIALTRLEFMSGNTAEAQRLAEELSPRTRTRADTVAVSFLIQDIHFARGEFLQGMDRVMACLALLGMPVSPRPTWQEAVAAHEEVWNLLGSRPIESLAGLPLMTDPDMKMGVAALFKLFPPAHSSNPNLLIVILSRMVALTLRHGFVADAVSGYAWFGVITGSFFNRHREGMAFARLALGFVDRHGLPFRAGVLLSTHFCSVWVEPLARARELILEGLSHARQSGSTSSASYCGSALVSLRLAMGHPLDEVYQESLARGEVVRKMGFVDPHEWLLVVQRYVQQLRGHTPSFQSLDGDGFEERAYEARMTPQRMGATRCHYWLFKLQSRYMCGAYEEAREAAEQVDGLLWATTGGLNAREGHFFRALALAACLEAAPPQRRQEDLAAIARHHQRLAQWAEPCPENFRALERLVFAEWARIEARSEEAIHAYEEAIRAAQENGATQYLALASELAAYFWRARRMPLVAQGFAHQAHAAYQQWGAHAKARQLEAQWPYLAAPEAHRDAQTTTTSGADSTHIDALTVVKAQQAVSGEIVLERLVTALMKAAIENAGAQRGALLLSQENTLAVSALFRLSPDGATLAPDEAGHHELPWTLLAYVRRTREHVLIGDASQPHEFSADPYLARGTARSVLCLPLIRQEVFSGALYLENNLATNAFSPARLALLGHLASQAAISIENARLYEDVQRARMELYQANDELERRVEERTRELKQAQARLVDTAREVGMTEVASNVLHNVGNVLTSAVIHLEMMRKAVGALRVGRLKQASALLVEHRQELADFLTKDPRGGHLPDYLTALSDDLMKDQMRLMEDMDAMSRHVEHIRAIIQVQQTYARNALLTEECDLAQLIDDALRIQLAALERHGVTLHRELSALPRVSADKHKVMQILINLISNANHALGQMPEGKRNLWVRLTAEGGVARIQVADDGVGIAPELMDSLFTHGFTTRKDGHGFGLHSSALAAKMMKGQLTLHSEGPHRGAVATLELPLSSRAGL
ncbi:hypothetical protein D187_007557 [Cystobacter fuscus DSM 2262]|uniref:Uncharacterized protein n=1 Tax=Cystobacter fuscus (strain ATCC 25194 / DSM 2262 / NBRC 100088 / M29) TaxID=1242864 RepID=S9NVK7_CYSF2|nr:ATP-binding sensor histidine kinase [Cystobacter fuscus]EPX56215.1 hypothetical protein D187_007557 [Cystobacter fuscus DSM 2262]